MADLYRKLAQEKGNDNPVVKQLEPLFLDAVKLVLSLAQEKSAADTRGSPSSSGVDVAGGVNANAGSAKPGRS